MVQWKRKFNLSKINMVLTTRQYYESRFFDSQYNNYVGLYKIISLLYIYTHVYTQTKLSTYESKVFT